MEQLTAVLERAQQRVAVLDPIDHRGRLEHFMFDVLDPAETSKKYALIPLAPDNGPVVMPNPVTLSPLAVRQLCQRLGMPVKFKDRLEELKQAKLLSINLNTLMQHNRNSLTMIRTIKGEGFRSARAILGSQYQPLDDAELLTVAAPYLAGADVAFSQFSESSTHITAVWPDTIQDGLARGVHIANSEVGMRAITVEAVAYREHCANILPALGLGGLGDGEQGYNEGNAYYRNKNRALKGSATTSWRFIHRGDTSRLASFVEDAVNDASRQYEGVVARWRQGLTDMVLDPIGAIGDVSNQCNLTAEHVKSVLASWAETRPDFGDCRTGITNAFTHAAQKEEDPEERYSLQSAGTFALGQYRLPN